MEEPEPILLGYGEAKKLTFEMTVDELKELAAAVLRRVKEKAFPKGRLIIYVRDHKVVAEWPDEHVEEIKRKNKDACLPNALCQGAPIAYCLLSPSRFTSAIRFCATRAAGYELWISP